MAVRATFSACRLIIDPRIEDSERAFLAGAYDLAFLALHGIVSAAADLIRVRLMLRVGRLPDADDLIGRLRTRGLNENERAQLEVLDFALQIRRRSPERSIKNRSEAKRLAEQLDLPELESEFWALDATDAYARNDLEQCERSAWNAVHCDLTLTANPSSRRAGITSLSNSKARALLYLSLVRGSQCRFYEQLPLIREAIVTLKQQETPDIYLLAYCYCNLGFFARDFGLLDDLVELELVDTSHWPESLQMLALEIVRSKSWLYALRGEYGCALTLLEDVARKREQALGCDGYWLAAVADSVIIASHSGYLRPKFDLTSALSVARSFPWAEHPDQRFTLLLFAQALSIESSIEASRLVSVAESLDPITYALVNADRRNDADRYYRIGVIRLNEGKVSEAIRLISDAFAIWLSCGHHWQATAAVLVLARHGLADQLTVSYARREALKYPMSWLMRDVKKWS